MTTTTTIPVRWVARNATEKARARRLTKSGSAKIVDRLHETYISGRGRLVNYEAWVVEEVQA